MLAQPTKRGQSGQRLRASDIIGHVGAAPLDPPAIATITIEICSTTKAKTDRADALSKLEAVEVAALQQIHCVRRNRREPIQWWSGTPVALCVSYEEFLDTERRSDLKHEWLDGVVYAMAGSTVEHTRLAANMTAALSRA